MAKFDTYFVSITFVFRLFNLTEIEFLFQICLITCIIIFLIYKFDNYNSQISGEKRHIYFIVVLYAKLLPYTYFFNSVF